MGTASVRTVSAADEPAAVQAIVLAFCADPAARWVWKDPCRYLNHMPGFVRAFGGRAFAHQTAHCTEDGTGAALWLPPGVHPEEEALGQVMEEAIEEATRNELAAVFEQLAEYHPAEPHWYLPLIGTDPALQGRGHGSALLKHALKICDAEKVPAYLEATSPRNVALYQRHQFEITGAIQAGNSPPITPMVRSPR